MSSFARELFNNALMHFFQSIPKKSYRFECDNISSKYDIRLNSGNEFAHCHKYPHKFEAFFAPSKSGNEIACLMIKPNENPNYTILFNHGGTVDLGNLCNFLFTLGQRLSCNVLVYGDSKDGDSGPGQLCRGTNQHPRWVVLVPLPADVLGYDYSGFGISPGTPTEKAVYADAETAFTLLLEKYQLTPDQIVIYGQSLGTAPTLHLAAKYPVKGAILHSPFLSTAKVFFPKMHSGSCRFYDFYKNIEMIAKTDVQLLIMHGTRDRIVPISHAKQLHQMARHPVNPLWVQGGGHDDLYTFEEYMKRLKRYFEFDLQEAFF